MIHKLHGTTLDGQHVSSPWGQLWPLLLTAALSLAVVLVVQLYVVPHVESRKRRENRWENDLRRLGEKIAFELENASAEYVSALYGMAFLAAVDRDPSREVRPDSTRGATDRLREARQRFRKAVGQVTWLGDQIIAAAPTEPSLRRLRLHLMGLRVKDLSSADPAYQQDDFEPTDEQVEIARKEHRAAVQAALDQVRLLAAGKMPRQPSRLGRLTSKFRRALDRRRRAHSSS